MSCQDACVVMDYDELNDFYAEARRRAAKPHTCCECHDDIAVGQSHHYASGKTDGGFWSARTCNPCHEIRLAFACDGWVFGQLNVAIDEQVFPGWNEMTAIDCLARLTTDAAIAKMREWYREWYADYRESRDQ